MDNLRSEKAPNLLVSVSRTQSEREPADVSISYCGEESTEDKSTRSAREKPVHVTLTIDDEEQLDYGSSPGRSVSRSSNESGNEAVEPTKQDRIDTFDIPLAQRCESDETKALTRDDLDLSNGEGRAAIRHTAPSTADLADIENLYDEFDLDLALLNGTESESYGWRLNVLTLRGVKNLSTENLLDYFAEFNPVGVEWLNDNACNVLWNDKLSAAKAMVSSTMQLKRMRDGLPYVAEMEGRDSESDAEFSSGEDDPCDGLNWTSPLKRMLRGLSPSAGTSDEEDHVMNEGPTVSGDLETKLDLDSVLADPYENVCYVDIDSVKVPKKGIWRVCKEFTSEGLVSVRFARKTDMPKQGRVSVSTGGQAESVMPRKRVRQLNHDSLDEPAEKKVYADLRYKLDEDNGSDRETVSELSESSHGASDEEKAPQKARKKKKVFKMRMRADREEEKQRQIKKRLNVQQKVGRHAPISDLRIQISRDARGEMDRYPEDGERFSDLDEDDAIVFV